MLNALTIDVEDYYQVSNFERHIARDDWKTYPSRVVGNTRRVLSLLAKHEVKATFFVLGYVADRHPELVAEIDAAGHEVASHSYWHRLVFQLTPQEFRSDLCRSRDVLQHIIQKPVTAFRAASFSINQHSLWALDILADEGFTADSSLQPMRMKRSDIPEHGRRPFAYQLASRTLWEFPLAVHRVGNRFGVPISGGGYFRLFPLHVTTRLLRRVNARCQAPFAFYIHPWEFDPEQPRLNAGTRSQRFRHYVNLATTESKFETLLKKFRFGRMDQVLANCRSTTISA